MTKWDLLREGWNSLLSQISNYSFIITSMMGAIIALRTEKGLSLWKGFLVWLTGSLTSTLIVLFINEYYKPGLVVLTVIAYFLGSVGNKLFLAFINFADCVIRDPKKTLTELLDVIKIILKIKNPNA